MNRSIQIIRLRMEGRWSARELGQALASLSDLYDLRLVLELMREDHREWEHLVDEMMHFPPFRRRWKRRGPFPGWLPLMHSMTGGPTLPLDDAQLSRLADLVEPEERLEVRRISYASPGSSDLAGVGAVIGHLKDFVMALIERRDHRRERNLKDDRAALENDRIRMENARNLVGLARELGYSESDFRRLAAHVDDKQDIIVQLIDRQKLRGVSDATESTEEPQ